MYSKYPLTIMLKLPDDPTRSVSALKFTDPVRAAADLLHVTILKLEDVDGRFPVAVTDMCKLLASFRMKPFDVVFDTVKREKNATELVSSRRLVEAKTLRQLLVDYLIDRCHLPLMRPGKLRPHVTLHYNTPGERFKQLIDPIQWRVDEILLIESVIGERRHVTHGRWPLIRDDTTTREFALPLFRGALGSSLPLT